MEMPYYAHPDDLDRRRRLLAFSRHDQPPRHLLIEFQADGTDYVVLQSGLEAALGDSWPAVVDVLTEVQSKLTRQEILDHWSPDYDKPDATTLWRWLSRAVAQGLVRQEGTGRPHDPFRYWLPEREEFMRPEGDSEEALQAWNARCNAELFARLDRTNSEKPAPAAPRSGNEDPTAAPAVAALQAKVVPLEPVPPPDPDPETAASACPTPDPL